jgi:Uma2 family endonuclease
MAIPAGKLRYSVAEYLRREKESLDKHEFRDGEIVLMAAGSGDHSLIVANVIRELGNSLKGKPCRVYDSNLRIRTPGTVTYTYPDASIICGQRQADPNDTSGETYTNPRVIIEVLSPGTEAYDRGEKFDVYRRIESLEEYILVSQFTARIETYVRRGEGSWLLTPVSGLSSTARIQSLDVDLPLGEVYAGIEFAPAQTAPADNAANDRAGGR